MSKILIGWELGGGHGHVVNMLALAKALRERGPSVVLAMRDLAPTYAVWRDAGFPVLAAPFMRPTAQAQRGFRARSLADVLAVQGYADNNVLQPNVRAWRALIDQVKPDLVCAEFAPSLCLAAHGREQKIAFGCGYSSPCLEHGSFPVLEAASPEFVSGDALRDAVGAALRDIGGKVPENPLAALLGEVQLHAGFPQADPYAALRAANASLPWQDIAANSAPWWDVPVAPPQLPDKPRVLIYLPPEHPAQLVIVNALRNCKIPGKIYPRGATPEVLALLRESALDVVATPFDMDVEIPLASLIVHHAGTGTADLAMAAGRPQLLLPITLEQHLVARAISQTGIATMVRDMDGFTRMPALIEAAVGDVALAQRAIKVATDLCGKFTGNRVDMIADSITATQ